LIKRILINLFLLFATFFLVNSFQNAQALNIYKIDVSIDSVQRTVNGTNEIIVYNNSKEVLDKLYFLLGLNNSYDTRMKVTEVSINDVIIPGSSYRYRYLGQDVEDRTIYQVALPNQLGPGESVNVKLKFDIANLSKINNILFLDDNINDIYMGSWYPRVINYEKGSWQKNNFPVNNYEVNATIGGDDIIAASGVEIESEALKGKGLKRINYKINNARGFALAISQMLTSETEEIKYDEKNGVVIKNYFKNNKSAKWNKTIMEIAKDVFSFYIKKFGTYPYRQLSILPGNSFNKGGYANNNMIVLHETLDSYKNSQDAENYLRWYICYLIGQQYFGYNVGESGEFPRWITSGASLHLAAAYLKEKNADDRVYKSLINQYISASRANFNTLVMQPVSELRQGNFDWENIIEKGKAAQIFKMLEIAIGRKGLQDSLKEVLLKYQHEIISTDAFEDIVESVSAKKLGDFFKQWVYESKSLDYAITRIKQNKTGNKYEVNISLKRLGRAVMPVSMAVTLKNGSKVFQIWDGVTSEAELTFTYQYPVKYIQLDPAETLPDTDRSNNLLNAPGI
jgi:hypothetical protein